MLIHQLLPLFALALNLLLLGSALVSDRRHHRNHVFACVAVALSVWNLGVFGLRVSETADAALAWQRLLHLGVIVVPALFYHYVLVFLDRPVRTPMLAAGYALAAAFLAASPSTLFLAGVERSTWGFHPAGGPLYAPFVVYCQTYLVLGLVTLVRAYRAMRSSFRRNRTSIVISGAAVSIVGGLVDFLRFMLDWDWIYPVGIPSNAVFGAALGIAIVRYRLWDVHVLAKRVILYGLMALVIVPAILFAVVSVIDGAPGPARFTAHLPLVLVLTVAVAGLLPFLRTVEGSVERFMFARQHGVRDALAALSRDMASILDLQQLGEALTAGLVERVPVLRASLYLGKDANAPFACVAEAQSPALEGAPAAPALDDRLVQWLRLTGRPLATEEIAHQATHDPTLAPLAAALEAARVALVVPLHLEGKLTAVLAVGEKVSGDVLGSGEIELLEMLVGQTATALKNATLYADIARRMEELRTAQQQLIQAAKLAAIGELAASVAHELNNPLMVIAGRMELLARKVRTGSPWEEDAEIIQSEAMRASRITRSLLDFSRKREPKHEPVDLNALVPRALDLLKPKLRVGRIAVESEMASALPRLLGDQDQLLQVLVNLVGNAADAMPDGGQLLVKTEIREDIDAVVLQVRDTGVGMSPEQLSRIFEPFYTTKAEGKGTGLGLSVTLGLVKSHRGTIRVESEVGNGTTMFVQFPAASSSPARVPAAA